MPKKFRSKLKGDAASWFTHGLSVADETAFEAAAHNMTRKEYLDWLAQKDQPPANADTVAIAAQPDQEIAIVNLSENARDLLAQISTLYDAAAPLPPDSANLQRILSEIAPLEVEFYDIACLAKQEGNPVWLLGGPERER